jgi:cytidine deaminase
MEKMVINSEVLVAQMSDLTDDERALVEMAIEATSRSYAPYSHFHVGAALQLKNGKRFIGCNQENAAFPAGICAERAAIFAAGAEYPEEPVAILALTARDTKGQLVAEPASPCGTCRQVIIETETRFKQPVRIILYGTERILIIDGIRQLMPLSFTEF